MIKLILLLTNLIINKSIYQHLNINILITPIKVVKDIHILSNLLHHIISILITNNTNLIILILITIKIKIIDYGKLPNQKMNITHLK
jgi:hypothetical protein